ncbi:conserved Plasmodium protein, unknown function [Plasmodium vinckei vinckei]|uniref:DNA-directed RNA polymerase III subunit RPC3 n=1 Tax=Plasmodium vinckei vinckei TaxID=54757 RepID=A0A449BT20_PLAVN|nr:conserved Plasmodium protein, unknown function [Plasmodium vinckei vinckei]KEG02387.1 hypothetical protein YYE_03126 [Plasmodium vinckei vinckei]VEV56630.1 conserved Plasmodium protein, unknown function [Plasmodium vinckei vinckei]
MISHELDYLKYIIYDAFGQRCSEIVELILLYGNKLSMNEIINLSNYDFSMIRNIILCLLIHNILDFRIIYNKTIECTHNSTTQDNEKINYINIESEKKKEYNKNTDNILFNSDNETEADKKTTTNVPIDTEIHFLSDLENYKYIKGCKCSSCICKIKRVEYYVIIRNIYILIRYSSMLYYIHPTCIKGVDTHSSEHLNNNTSPSNNITTSTVSNSITNPPTISTNSNPIKNIPTSYNMPKCVNYNFFTTNIIADTACIYNNDMTKVESDYNINYLSDKYRNSSYIEDEEVNKNYLTNFIEKVILIRIIKNGRVTLDDCLKNIKLDEYVEVCKKDISNISKNKLRLIFIQLLKKNIIKKCKQFNEHICDNKTKSPENNITFNTSLNYIDTNYELTDKQISYTSHKYINNPNNIDEQPFLNFSKKNGINTQTPINTQVNEYNNYEQNQNVEKKRNHYTSCVGQIENDLIDSSDFTNNINIINSVNEYEKKQIQNSPNKKSKTNRNHNILSYNETEWQHNYIDSNFKNNNNNNNNNNNKNNQNEYRTNIDEKTNLIASDQYRIKKEVTQNNIIEHLDNPYTYFQVNSEVLTSLYLKQECFNFISYYYNMNDIAKCILFFLLNNIQLNYSEDENKFNDTVSYSTYEHIEKYVHSKLKSKKINIDKNMILQNLNILIKYPDQLITVRYNDIITYAVDFNNIKFIYQKKITTNMIENMNGLDALRIWNFLIYTPDHKYNDEIISENVLIPLNDIRKKLYNLLYSGYIKCHECNNNNTTKTYIKHSLSFSSNLYYTNNQVNENLFTVAKNIFVRRNFENNEINTLHNKSNICLTEFDQIIDTDFSHNQNSNTLENDTKLNSKNLIDITSSEFSDTHPNNTTTNRNINQNKKKNITLTDREYAVDYLEISLINIDKLIFIFNS